MNRNLCTIILFSLISIFSACSAPINSISQQTLFNKMKSDNKPILLDVRSTDEFSQGHIVGALNIPHSELAERIQELGVNKQINIVTYCRSGRRAKVAQDLLLSNGFNEIEHLEGDYPLWLKNGMPIKK
jgi:phage shock protein E